jgi:hypothetical protein
MMENYTALLSIEQKLGDTTRGLENRTEEGEDRSTLYRMKAYDAVFKLQKTQMVKNINNPDAIAKAYSKSCQGSKEVASMLGLRDQKDVKEQVYQSTNTSTLEKPRSQSSRYRSPLLSRSPALSPQRRQESEKNMRTSRRQRLKKELSHGFPTTGRFKT